MNLLTIVGTLQKIKVVGTNVEAIVEVRKKGYGQNAAKTFTTRIRCRVWSKNPQELMDSLRIGDIVHASGEAGTEVYQSTQGEKKWMGALTMFARDFAGFVAPSGDGQGAPPPRSAPAPAPTSRYEAPDADDCPV